MLPYAVSFHVAKIAGHQSLMEPERGLLLSHGQLLDTSDSFVHKAYRAGLDAHDAHDGESDQLSEFTTGAADCVRHICKTTVEDPSLERALRYRLRRVAVSEAVGAYNLGKAHKIRRALGADALIGKQLRGSSCALCSSLHNHSNGLMRAYKLSSLPVRSPRGMSIGPAHPGCLCELVHVDQEYLIRNVVRADPISFGTGTGGPSLLGNIGAVVAQPTTSVETRELLQDAADDSVKPEDVIDRGNSAKIWLNAQPEIKYVLPIIETELPNLANDLDPVGMRSVRNALFAEIDRDIKAAEGTAPMRRLDLPLATD